MDELAGHLKVRLGEFLKLTNISSPMLYFSTTNIEKQYVYHFYEFIQESKQKSLKKTTEWL